MTPEYLEQLNGPQRLAVEYCDGPELVIAGAGSGKTRVLTYKIVHLLAHGYEPWRILALTFTNKAAREMRERIRALVGEKTASKLWMGTFHSVFARILRSNAGHIGYGRDYTIYDTADSKALIKTIIRDMQLDDKVYKPNIVQSAISMAKNALMSPETYRRDRDLQEYDRRSGRPLIADIYAAYRSRCKIAGAMDFDDLLYNTNVLLRDFPEIKRHYQEYFRYILVDEYQDTNFAQHLIVSQLAVGEGACNRVCVVGDDAQSIYSFRGANISNILNLRNSYPGLETFKLEQNYRSTGNIIDAANRLIDKNKSQIRKHVFTTGGDGERLEVMRCYSEFEEARNVAAKVSVRHTSTGDSYEDFAILYRTNAQSRVLEQALRKFNIPFRIYGGLSFYQRKEIRDAIAYFRLAINPDDDEALRRVINYPARGIGDTTVGKLARAALEHRVSLWTVINNLDKYEVPVNKGTAGRIRAFADIIRSFVDMNLRGCNAADMATHIMNRTRLLAELVSDNTPETISKRENLQELLQDTREFVVDKEEAGEAAEATLTNFLAEVSLATDQDKADDTEVERVTLMTVHAAKGLEFGNVIIVGVEEELFPSALSMSSAKDIEEERRLMYVAITRAKRYCLLTYAGSRMRNGQTTLCRPSRFISDIGIECFRQVNGNDAGDSFNPAERYRSSYHSQLQYTRPVSVRQSASRAPERTAAPAHTQAFGDDIPATHDVSELAEGMTIIHQRFGRGTIERIDTTNIDPRIIVKFGNCDTKTLLLKFAMFTIPAQ